MFHQQLRITKILARGVLLTMEVKDAQYKQWRIQDFPEVGEQILQGVANIWFFL